jgi:hypothetical protein
MNQDITHLKNLRFTAVKDQLHYEEPPVSALKNIILKIERRKKKKYVRLLDLATITLTSRLRARCVGEASAFVEGGHSHTRVLTPVLGISLGGSGYFHVL